MRAGDLAGQQRFHARGGRRLVDLLGSFAEATDSEVVAEGVETKEEAAALADAGVDLMQGYLYGEPSLSLSA